MARVARFFKKNIFSSSLIVPKVAIDLTASSVHIYLYEAEYLFSYPSLLATHIPTQSVIAVGQQAQQMIGKAPKEIMISSPMKAGKVTDVDEAVALIQFGFQEVRKNLHSHLALFQPHLYFFLPPNTTQVLYRAYTQIAKKLATVQYTFLHSSYVLLIGCGKQISSTQTQMIVEVGYDQVCISVIFAERLVRYSTTHFGSKELSKSLKAQIRTLYSLEIGEDGVEQIIQKIQLWDNLLIEHKDQYFVVRGREIVSGAPKSMKVSSTQLQPVLQEFAESILESVRDVFLDIQAELITDIIHNGMFLVGDGAKLNGLKLSLEKEFGTFVYTPEYDTSLPIHGLKKILQSPDLLLKTEFEPYW